MTHGPTERQLDALAAWWQCGGSGVKAARVMGVTTQVLRNTLMQFRRQEKVDTTLLLALRFLTDIEGRVVHHNVDGRQREHGAEHDSGVSLSPFQMQQNISFRSETPTVSFVHAQSTNGCSHRGRVGEAFAEVIGRAGPSATRTTGREAVASGPRTPRNHRGRSTSSGRGGIHPATTAWDSRRASQWGSVA